MRIFQTGLDGLQRAQSAIEATAARIARLPTGVDPIPTDIVDISAQAVALLLAKNAYKASLKAIETGTELSRSTLDLLG
jgi:flagellar hook protein FlgE